MAISNHCWNLLGLNSVLTMPPKKHYPLDSLDSSLCTNCVKDEQLKRLIEMQGRSAGTCKICGEIDPKAVSIAKQELRNLFRALIRLHYSGWHYNGRLGGDPLYKLLSQENPILNYQMEWN